MSKMFQQDIQKTPSNPRVKNIKFGGEKIQTIKGRVLLG